VTPLRSITAERTAGEHSIRVPKLRADREISYRLSFVRSTGYLISRRRNANPFSPGPNRSTPAWRFRNEGCEVAQPLAVGEADAPASIDLPSVSTPTRSPALPPLTEVRSGTGSRASAPVPRTDNGHADARGLHGPPGARSSRDAAGTRRRRDPPRSVEPPGAGSTVLTLRDDVHSLVVPSGWSVPTVGGGRDPRIEDGRDLLIGDGRDLTTSGR
jgi:hypothetical protein